MTNWRRHLAAALAASTCLVGPAAVAQAAPGARDRGREASRFGRRASDHPKLDRKLNDRADTGGSGTSRVIIELNPGWDAGADIQRAGGRRGRKLGIISGEVVELPNSVLRRLADSPAVKAIHWDRKTGGEMNRAAIVEGARAVQAAYGYDGAGIGVAIIDSGITSWHDDLTYQGSNPAVKVVGGQRVTKFVDFVNGRLTPYDDNGHGTHVAGIIGGNGYDTLGARAGMAPAANLVSLKVLDDHGGGYISNVIAALDWVVQNKALYNIRVVNLSVGAAVTESYLTDPLTLAAKRVVDAGVVVVTAAGNLGKNPQTGKLQYGSITAPGNAPWVLTVGAYSHEGTLTRRDDEMASYSSRGPTAGDFLAKPDVVATGTGIVSLAVPGSTFYSSKASYLLAGSVKTANKPYLSLTGTSMAAPIVTGTVALMLQANPKLTPNLVKGIIEYTAQDYKYDALSQGAGFLNAKGAVDLARFLKNPKPGQVYPSSREWSQTIIWGNHKLKKGVIKPTGSAWASNVVWGATRSAEGDNIVWGTVCARRECDNIVWGTTAMDADNIVWGTFAREADNIVWGTVREADNIVWGTLREADNIVWGTARGEDDNIVWGTECGGRDCDNIVWGTSIGTSELANIVWGTALEADNIVWGTSGEVDNIVWGTSSEADDVTWGCSGEETPLFDDPDVPSAFDGSPAMFDSLFDSSDPAPDSTLTTTEAPLAVEPTTTSGSATALLTTVATTTTALIGGGL